MTTSVLYTKCYKASVPSIALLGCLSGSKLGWVGARIVHQCCPTTSALVAACRAASQAQPPHPILPPWQLQPPSPLLPSLVLKPPLPNLAARRQQIMNHILMTLNQFVHYILTLAFCKDLKTNEIDKHAIASGFCSAFYLFQLLGYHEMTRELSRAPSAARSIKKCHATQIEGKQLIGIFTMD